MDKVANILVALTIPLLIILNFNQTIITDFDDQWTAYFMSERILFMWLSGIILIVFRKKMLYTSLCIFSIGLMELIGQIFEVNQQGTFFHEIFMIVIIVSLFVIVRELYLKLR